MIEHYSFGKMIVDGRTFAADLIIYPDGRIQDSWWRKQGHFLCLEDIAELVDAGPELIIVGTGNPGLMKPDARLKEELAEENIRLEVFRTSKAADRYNALHEDKNVAACFHLTC